MVETNTPANGVLPSNSQTVVSWLAAANPSNLALLAPGRSSMRHGELCALIVEAASRLNAAGIRRGDRVALVLSNGPEMAAAFLAVVSVATCAPLNPAYRAAEFEYYLDDLRPKAIILEAGADTPVRRIAQARGIRILELHSLRNEPAGRFRLDFPAYEVAIQPEWAEPGDVALVLHTSGTTSRPKMVPLTQSNLCHSAKNIRSTLRLEASDRCLNVMPLFHIHGLVGATLSSITAGAGIICTPAFLAPQFFEWMDQMKPTWYTAVPTMHQAILARAAANREIIARQPLRFIRSSSAPLPPSVMTELERTFDAPVIESYGMTEASHQMASNPLPPSERKPGCVGLPAGPDIAIMDEQGVLLPHGEVGNVVIRGPSVFGGYECNPEANASAFIDGWFRTGDLGRIDEDGYLFLAGRTKEIINRGGEKISPREVDEILMEHPSVAQALAFALPDARLGEDVGAAVVLRDGAAVAEMELSDFVAERLADFKVPRRIIFLDEIPKGPTGKPQRIGLAATLGLTNPAPSQAASAPCTETEHTETESWLLELFREILDVTSAGVEDDFFDLGGDSILATQLAARIHATRGIDFLPIRIFQLKTAAAIAAHLDSLAKSPMVSLEFGSSLVPFQPTGSGPILFLVPRLGALGFRTLAKHLGSGQRVYGMEPPGIHNGESPIASMELLATYYIQQIRKVQQSGPYLLGGYSFGGFPAYEMACQLKREGEHVALLWLIDSDIRSLPQYLATLPKRRLWLDQLRHLAQVLQFHSAAMRQLPASQQLGYLFRVVSKKHRKLQSMRTNFDAEGLPPAVREVELSNRKARANYVPKSYSDQITLVRSTVGVKGFDRTNGWGDLAASIDVYDVPGSSHLNILAEPHVEKTAQILRLAIEKALAKHRSGGYDRCRRDESLVAAHPFGRGSEG